MDINAFKEVFAAEARDYLQSLNDDLLSFENDPENGSILDEMFRAAHSLKGMAGTMGFDELAEFTHEMESVLDLLRTGELKPSPDVINVLFRAVDTLEVLLEQTINEEPISSFREELAALETLMAGDVGVAPTGEKHASKITVTLDEFNRETIKQGLEQGYHCYKVIVTLRDNTILKSVRVYTVFQAVEEIGTIIQSNPPAQDLEDEKFDDQFGLIILTRESGSKVQAIIEGISEIQQAEISELELEKGAVDVGAQEVKVTQAPKGKRMDSPEPRTPPVRTQRQETLVRVETERLDKLINLVGELVISRTQVVEMTSDEDNADQKTALAQLDRVTTELQYAAMSLRMVPIKQVFDRFPRMVRDLAQSSKKDIHLEIFGETTELDRSIVNQIGDPLVHLIRNSIDHGLESKEVRVANGKPPTGTIRLGARHEGSHILIEISDDGQGLNVDRIREKGIERGLLAEDSGPITVREAADLLFHPGFSTAEAVTDLSGRGVGLDAVKATVESLSGTIDMESVPGQSLRTIIKLPLTLAIIKALLVIVDGETIAIPIQAVRENIQIEKEQIKTVQQNDVILLRNEVLPLYDLAEVLGFNRLDLEGPLPVIIVETRGQKIGFIVEDLIGQQEIVIKSLSGIINDIQGIAGATVLGNGNVALILDNSTIIR